MNKKGARGDKIGLKTNLKRVIIVAILRVCHLDRRDLYQILSKSRVKH